MEVRDDNDPYASIAALCLISLSQEAFLKNCPFAGQSDSPGSGDDVSQPENRQTPVESTGICMVSPPETPKDDNSIGEEYHTPPEESFISSSDEAKAMAFRCKDDLRVGGGKSKTVVVNDSHAKGDPTVDLKRNSDLGFLDVKISSVRVASKRKDADSGRNLLKRLKTCDDNNSSAEIQSRKPTVRTVDDSVTETVVKCKDAEIMENNEVISVERDGLMSLAEATEVLEPAREKNSGAREMSEIEDDGRAFTKRRSIDDIEEFRYVNSRHSNLHSGNVISAQGRRELPPSIINRPKNGVGGGDDLDRRTKRSSEDQIAMGILNVLKMLAEKCRAGREDGGDMLEIVKSRGMTFPRPSWWPPEGPEKQ